jgi:hypothetical protein
VKRAFIFVVMLLSVGAMAQARHKALGWSYKTMKDEVDNRDFDYWTITSTDNPKAIAAIIDCRTFWITVHNEVLDYKGDPYRHVKYRTSDMDNPEELGPNWSTLDAVGWHMEVARGFFWPKGGDLETKLMMRLDTFPEGSVTLSFNLPPVPDKCR